MRQMETERFDTGNWQVSIDRRPSSAKSVKDRHDCSLRLLAAPHWLRARGGSLKWQTIVLFLKDTTELRDAPDWARRRPSHLRGYACQSSPGGAVATHPSQMARTAIKSGHGAFHVMKCSCNPANNREMPEETSPAAGEVARPDTTSGSQSASSSPYRWPCRSATPPSPLNSCAKASFEREGRIGGVLRHAAGSTGGLTLSASPA